MHGADFAHAGQEHQQRTGPVGQCMAYGSDNCVGQALIAARWAILDFHRIAAPFAGQHRCIIENSGQRLGIQCRRHHHQPQVGPQRLLRLARQRQCQVGISERS